MNTSSAFFTFWITVFASSLCVAQNAAAPPAPYPTIKSPDFSKLPVAEVSEIVDGDTVKVIRDGQQITCGLIGLNTPETKQPTKSVQDYGKEASTFTENLLKGERVWVAYDQGGSAKDAYNRDLVFLFRVPDGLFINLEIVRQGYGRVQTVYPFYQMEVFREFERRAREAGKGLWASAEAVGMPAAPSASAFTPGSKDIFEAVASNNLQEVQYFISHKVDLTARNKDGVTPLHVAVQKDNPQAVEALLKGGSDVNQKDSLGDTPLHYAALGKASMVALLLKYGADKTVLDGQGHSPLQIANEAGYRDVVEALSGFNSALTPDVRSNLRYNEMYQRQPGQAAPQASQNDSVTVYITRAGKKYHAAGCRSLSKSRIPISLSDAKGKGYGPCAICNPPR